MDFTYFLQPEPKHFADRYFFHCTLSENGRRSAERLAEHLLQTTTPEAGFNAIEFCERMSIREALNSPFMKPHNVVGALVSGSESRWWCDIFFRTPDYISSLGLREDSPANTREEAESSLRKLMGNLPVMQEHPIVHECRKRGLAPEAVWCLKIYRTNEQCKLVFREKGQVQLEREEFMQQFESFDPEDDVWYHSARHQAEEILLKNWDRLPPFLEDAQFDRALCEAVSFFTIDGGVCLNRPVSVVTLSA